MSGDGKRYAVDAATALRIVREDVTIGERHALVGPAVLRSDVLEMIYEAVRAGELDERAAKAELDALAALKIRLLGDRVSRMTAFRLARRFDADRIDTLEYLAVASLQADVLVCVDRRLVDLASDVIPIASFDELQR